MPIPDKIARMKAGSFDNLVYPERANEIIDTLNAVRQMKLKIKIGNQLVDGEVKWADAGVTLIVSSGSYGSTPNTGSAQPIISGSSIFCLAKWS